jgi:hypothetical protein
MMVRTVDESPVDGVLAEAKEAWDDGLPAFVYLPPAGVEGPELSRSVSTVLSIGWLLQSSALGGNTDGVTQVSRAMFTFLRPYGA